MEFLNEKKLSTNSVKPSFNYNLLYIINLLFFFINT